MSDPADRPAQGLALDGVGKTFRQAGRALEVLHGVNFRIQSGELAALVGPSGAGKSTLLHIAGLLERPDEGEITIAGTACSQLADGQRTELRRSPRRLRKYFTRKDDAKRLQDARTSFRTGADGVMLIPVPAAKVRTGFTLKLSLAGTPIVLETRDVLTRRSPSGPTVPATNTSLNEASTTRRANSAPARLILAELSPRPCSPSLKRLAPKVLVWIMLAPASI